MASLNEGIPLSFGGTVLVIKKSNMNSLNRKWENNITAIYWHSQCKGLMELSLTEDKLRSFIESVTHLSWILKNSKDLPGKRKSKQKKNYM